MDRPAQPILLVGISMRMLAELAVRAGYEVFTLDYFGDADLQALCPGKSLRRDFGSAYSAAALVDAALTLPMESPAVVYGASLENHPDQAARLDAWGRLLGNGPAVLKQIRNPLLLAKSLPAAGFPFPRAMPPERKPAVASLQKWLWKPRRSGGGHGVQVWQGQPLPADGIFQEWLPGMVGSAAFAANGREATLLGLTQQLAGVDFTAAGDFRYGGNLLPPPLPAVELKQLLQQTRQIIRFLTLAFGLKGLNGLDFIWHDGQTWTIEVNPRPTASMELMDAAYNVRLFDAHVRSFAGHLPAFDLAQAVFDAPAAGKAIIYADDDLTVGDTASWAGQGIRDVPYAGEIIKRGRPICTLLATAATPAACQEKLRAQAAELRTRISIISECRGEPACSPGGGQTPGSAPTSGY